MLLWFVHSPERANGLLTRSLQISLSLSFLFLRGVWEVLCWGIVRKINFHLRVIAMLVVVCFLLFNVSSSCCVYMIFAFIVFARYITINSLEFSLLVISFFIVETECKYCGRATKLNNVVFFTFYATESSSFSFFLSLR